jgi:hypothetical protein
VGKTVWGNAKRDNPAGLGGGLVNDSNSVLTDAKTWGHWREYDKGHIMSEPYVCTVVKLSMLSDSNI